VLPDLEDDARTGIAGLPHRMGRRWSGVVITVALVVGALLAFFGPSGERTALQWVGLVLTALLALAIALALRRPPTRALFQLIIAAALVNVLLLAFSGTRALGESVSGAGFAPFRIPIQAVTPPITSRIAVTADPRWNPPTSSFEPTITPTNAIAMRPATRETALLIADPIPA
jgi:hypothetical protein